MRKRNIKRIVVYVMVIVLSASLLMGTVSGAASIEIPTNEIGTFTSLNSGYLLNTFLYWFLDRNDPEVYPYYAVVQESSTQATVMFFGDIDSYRVVNTNVGMNNESYSVYVKPKGAKVYRINQGSPYKVYDVTADYLGVEMGFGADRIQLFPVYTNVLKDKGVTISSLFNVNMNANLKKTLYENLPQYDSYYDFIKNGAGGGYTSKDKEFLQSIISQITLIMELQMGGISSGVTEISNKLVEELYKLEQIKQETIKSAQEISESVKQSALDMIEAQKSALIDVNNPDSLISQFNDGFKAGVVDGLSGSKSGYQAKDVNGNPIPINPETGEYILPIDPDTGKPIIPVDENGNELIPTNPDGTPKNSRDIGKTDILQMSIKNVEKVEGEISEGLKKSFNELKKYMSTDRLSSLMSTFDFVKNIFELILDKIGSVMQSVIIVGLTFGLCLWLIGVGVKDSRR